MKITSASSKLSDEELNVIRKKLRSNTCTQEDKKRFVEDMSYHGCSWVEIASILGVTRQTIDDKYRDVLNIGQSHFKHDLRRFQLACANNTRVGNPAMLIWLGKQYLEQSETPQMEVKKDQFDEFIEWISRQKVPSSPPVPSKSIAS